MNRLTPPHTPRPQIPPHTPRGAAADGFQTPPARPPQLSPPPAPVINKNQKKADHLNNQLSSLERKTIQLRANINELLHQENDTSATLASYRDAQELPLPQNTINIISHSLDGTQAADRLARIRNNLDYLKDPACNSLLSDYQSLSQTINTLNTLNTLNNIDVSQRLSPNFQQRLNRILVLLNRA